ncbi:hypothetical protein B0H65DRAFT_468477 [Neurospora tetraspora]|uniref:Uncharacterized protein n=1 Tax=Neurospora tetraspora TaxID=94610 RepID=A0AAE0JCU8_9PEZI|nr:hypothetical protein B0H65DRAFT_468477 [Neurospora tetraspora]
MVIWCHALWLLLTFLLRFYFLCMLAVLVALDVNYHGSLPLAGHHHVHVHVHVDRKPSIDLSIHSLWTCAPPFHPSCYFTWFPSQC